MCILPLVGPICLFGVDPRSFFYTRLVFFSFLLPECPPPGFHNHHDTAFRSYWTAAVLFLQQRPAANPTGQRWPMCTLQVICVSSRPFFTVYISYYYYYYYSWRGQKAFRDRDKAKPIARAAVRAKIIIGFNETSV